MKKELQKAILAAIENIVDNTENNVSYEVYTSVEKSGWGKNKNVNVRHHIDIIISESIIDTRPSRTKLT